MARISKIDELTKEVHKYNLEVTKSLAVISTNCDHCRSTVSDHDTQLKAVTSLKESFASLKRNINVAWTVFTIATGLVLAFVKK